MGGRSGGRLGEDANPNGDRNWFLSLFFFLAVGLFVDINPLETNDVDRRKADLEIPVSRLYDMMNIN